MPKLMKMAQVTRVRVGSKLRVGCLERLQEPIYSTDDTCAVRYSPPRDVERARGGCRVRCGDSLVSVGTRLGVVAPRENVGQIIIGEEQENRFKQEETP